MCRSRGGSGAPDPPPPLKNHKNKGFSSNTGLDPLKNRSYKASIQCWAIIRMPAKSHLMAFRWRVDDGLLIVVLGYSLPSSTKKIVIKVGPRLTKHFGSAHDICSLFESKHALLIIKVLVSKDCVPLVYYLFCFVFFWERLHTNQANFIETCKK